MYGTLKDLVEFHTNVVVVCPVLVLDSASCRDISQPDPPQLHSLPSAFHQYHEAKRKHYTPPPEYDASQKHLLQLKSFHSTSPLNIRLRHGLCSRLRQTALRRSFRFNKKGKKTNKSMYECKRSEQYDTADVPTYEEVAPYCRAQEAKYRLVILVAKRNQECDGVEYHFISKHLFETDIQNNKFIEYGEYKGNYYGTNLDSIHSVIAKNKVCLLDVQPHCLKHLRTAEFKPYVVFVKPPSIHRLRDTRKNTKTISGKGDKDAPKPLTYGHLFDLVLVNDDLSSAFRELKQALRKLETETHWVPVSWTHS
ncbi:MAGUK p55 subfamily member 7 [Bagarius yarrelli]|uniref:MAGUK p55 subfamily member 7 n=1 Tax=Bagarius yarrelli TaxID=175774 RepID=A0A556V8L8_BAGYA|nr:MAGUK p55 subfamily member 7 [Bagarius yarrelli]